MRYTAEKKDSSYPLRPRRSALACGVALVALAGALTLTACVPEQPTPTAYVATPTPLPPTPTSFLAPLTPTAAAEGYEFLGLTARPPGAVSVQIDHIGDQAGDLLLSE